jgi:hypothetical protein
MVWKFHKDGEGYLTIDDPEHGGIGMPEREAKRLQKFLNAMYIEKVVVKKRKAKFLSGLKS